MHDASLCIAVARGGQWGHAPPKFLEHTVILCFERRFPKQNSFIRLKSNSVAPLKFFAPPQIFELATTLSLCHHSNQDFRTAVILRMSKQSDIIEVGLITYVRVFHEVMFN